MNHYDATWQQCSDHEGRPMWINAHTGQATYLLHDGGGLSNSYYQGPTNYAAPPVAMGVPPPNHMMQQGPPHPSGHFSPGEADRPGSMAWKMIGLGLLVTGAAKRVLPAGGVSRDRLSKKVQAARQFGRPSHL